jgi:hypothetical protein
VRRQGQDLDERQVQVDPAWYLSAAGVAAHRTTAEDRAGRERAWRSCTTTLNGNFFRVVRMNGTHRTDIERRRWETSSVGGKATRSSST